MAFAFSSSKKHEDGPVKVECIRLEPCRYLQALTHSCSIVFVPAIGADPRKTWTRDPDKDGFEHRRFDYVLHDRLYPKAQTHLYDHLMPEERKVEVIHAQGPNDERHNASVKAFAAAEARVAAYGIREICRSLVECKGLASDLHYSSAIVPGVLLLSKRLSGNLPLAKATSRPYA